MRSEFGWVDFSSEHRDRVRLVLQALAEPGTLDELGIGPLRDGFSEKLFPAFSTIQTRAKYLITVPRLLRDYELVPLKERKRRSARSWLKEQEDEVARLLVARHGSDEAGIVGATMIDKGGVARPPSTLYWNALRTWKIIDTQKSLDQFLRSMAEPDTSEAENLGDDGVDDPHAVPAMKSIQLDRIDRAWRENLSLSLSHSEAEFLVEKFRDGPSQSVPAQLVNAGLLETAVREEYGAYPAFCAWFCAQPGISQETIVRMRLALQFSECLYGAHIRYNCLIARRNERDDLLSSYEEKWRQWLSGVRIEQGFEERWISESGANVRQYTRRFLKAWCEGISAGDGVEMLDQLVERQVRDNKSEALAKLFKRLPGNLGWVGIDHLSFRWGRVQIILRDVVGGLNAEPV